MEVVPILSSSALMAPLYPPPLDQAPTALKRGYDNLVCSPLDEIEVSRKKVVVKIEADSSSESEMACSDSENRKPKRRKRPQMKYDPDVPMTKEETSAWRREQRRKRNRESAAACRQRQRERITELEVEVNEWKAKFDEAFAKLKEVGATDSSELEAEFLKDINPRCSTPENDQAVYVASPQPDETVSSCLSSDSVPFQQGHVVSPHTSPSFVSPITFSDSPRLPVIEESVVKSGVTYGLTPRRSNSRVEKRQHLNEIITRPAKSRLLTSRLRWVENCFWGLLTQ
jgi:hypothetical protein